MQEYAQKPEKSSSDSNSRSSGQPLISEILQAYKNGTLQRMSVDEKKMLQAKTRDKSFERETLQQYTEYTHRDKSRYNSFIQGMFDTPQRKGVGNEEPLQGKFDSSSAASESTVQREVKPNNTGLPDNLKSGIENLSGYSMDDVRVHYNSDKPAQLSALAYAQGTDIHVAPGQEQHLPHEAWHVVQQKQGRVQPTMQMQGVCVNDNQGLEKEADVMGECGMNQSVQESRAIAYNGGGNKQLGKFIDKKDPIVQKNPIQREPTGDMTCDQIIESTAHPDVKKAINALPKDKLVTLLEASQDNPEVFKEAIKSPDFFSNSRDWYSFYLSIPNKSKAIYKVKELAKKGKLMPTGSATLEQLGEIYAFTQNGDMTNVPLRYQPTWESQKLAARHKTLVDGMRILSAAPGRSATGEVVYSGKAFNIADFQSKISGKTGSKVPLLGMVSSTSKIETAEGFVKLTEKWASVGAEKPVGVIFRIHSTAGVHIDDLSEWGRHTGRETHWDASPDIQVQDEVLMDQGDFIQTSEPVKYKMVDGVQYYFVDCEEPKRERSMPADAIAPRTSTSFPISSHGTMASEGITPTIPFSQESDRHKSSFHTPGRLPWK